MAQKKEDEKIYILVSPSDKINGMAVKVGREIENWLDQPAKHSEDYMRRTYGLYDDRSKVIQVTRVPGPYDDDPEMTKDWRIAPWNGFWVNELEISGTPYNVNLNPSPDEYDSYIKSDMIQCIFDNCREIAVQIVGTSFQLPDHTTNVKLKCGHCKGSWIEKYRLKGVDDYVPTYDDRRSTDKKAETDDLPPTDGWTVSE